jgi:thioredoxin
MATTNVTAADFESLVARDGITLIDFWASWCGPCRAFGPVFERVSQKHPDVAFAKVDTQAEEQLAGALGIQSIPTLMVFRDRVLIYAQPGALPEDALEDLVAQARALDMDEVRRKIEEERKAAS